VQRFPAVSKNAQLIALGNRGGFSGARLWHVETPGEAFCLKAWPPQAPSVQRLARIHQLMHSARASGLSFVPALLQSDRGTTWTEHEGRLWDLTTWMPGQADFRAVPTASRLEAACIAVAQLHAVWARATPQIGVCPAIRRRLERVREWLTLVKSGWQPRWEDRLDDPVRHWAERAWICLTGGMESLPTVLGPWSERRMPLHPCLCDIWHDHLLFQGEVVAGIIDYGAVKTDHVAVDLARLLGSLVGDEKKLRAAGLSAYRRVRPLSWEEETLVDFLDESGTWIGLANWLEWLYREKRVFEDRQAVAGRLADLVLRVENWLSRQS